MRSGRFEVGFGTLQTVRQYMFIVLAMRNSSGRGEDKLCNLGGHVVGEVGRTKKSSACER